SDWRFEISEAGPARDGTAPEHRLRSGLRSRLRSCSNERGRGVKGGVVEVDFFDEADGQLIVGEIDVLGGVEARAAVLAHPPEGHGAEDGDGGVGSDAGGETLHNVGPDNRITVQDGGAVGQALIDIWFGGGFESGKLGFPGAVEVIGGETTVQGRL